MNKFIGSFASARTKFSIVLALSFIISACGGNPPTIEAIPEPAPPSLTSEQFCEEIKNVICSNTDDCGVLTYADCYVALSLEWPPCGQWTADKVCPEGTVYNGERAYTCIEPLDAMTCENATIPLACAADSYCLPPGIQ